MSVDAGTIRDFNTANRVQELELRIKDHLTRFPGHTILAGEHCTVYGTDDETYTIFADDSLTDRLLRIYTKYIAVGSTQIAYKKIEYYNKGTLYRRIVESDFVYEAALPNRELQHKTSIYDY